MTRKTVALQKRSESNLEVTRNKSVRRVNMAKRITANRNVTPPVDIIESDSEITLLADMPGVEREDLHVFVEKDLLKIEGRRDAPHPENFDWEDTEPEYERIHYYREFRLGSGIQKEQLEAVYQDGVLRVILPKTKEARPRRIEIRQDR